jgi:ribosomal protein S8
MTPTKLSDKVVLVKLTLRRAALTKRDAYLSDKIQRQEGDTSLTVLTKLFKDKSSAINEIMSKYGEVYQYHKKNTLPYVDAGPRILPNDLYMEYTQEMKHRIAQVDNMLDTYMPMYDQLVQDDVMYRNAGHAAGRANASEYPTADDFRMSMSAELRFQPMPDASHFLFDLSEDDVASFKRAEEEAAQAANADTVQRMLKPIQALVTKLGEYQGLKGERFHNSLVENVIDGCTLARKLAINPTPELLADITELEEAAQGYLKDVEMIKGSANKRDEAKKKLQDVASKMAMFS